MRNAGYLGAFVIGAVVSVLAGISAAGALAGVLGLGWAAGIRAALLGPPLVAAMVVAEELLFRVQLLAAPDLLQHVPFLIALGAVAVLTRRVVRENKNRLGTRMLPAR